MKGAAAGSLALAALAGGIPGLTRADAAPAARRVAVLGGGVAGLTAAHELAERGFEVTVYDRKGWGGKARSMDTPFLGVDGRAPLPGEHGYRFFPGFFAALPDTMRRIPYPGNAKGTFDNLVPALALTGALNAPDITLPFALDFDAIGLALEPRKAVKTLLAGLTWLPRLPLADLTVLVRRLLVFLTSCDERRYGQWEHQSFKDFVKMDGTDPNYQLLISTFTRTLVAAKEDIAGARSICGLAESFLLNIINRGNDNRFPDSVLDGPSNEVWIDPWIACLRGLGVRFELGTEVRSLSVAGGVIDGATVEFAGGGTRAVAADWYVLAVPPERAAGLLGPDILELAPELAGIADIDLDWMNGVQFFLGRERPIGQGHIGFIETPWRLSGIHQNQFWKREIADGYGDGKVADILSVCVADWDAPGLRNTKRARDCRPEEVAAEVWHQIMLSQQGEPLTDRLGDQDVLGWFLDPAIRWDGAVNGNDHPLTINSAGSWDLRPGAATAIPNLFLAGDYTRNNIDLACMEGANEGGRTARNALLTAAGSDAGPARLWPKLTLREFDGARAMDLARWRAGQPNLLDLPG
ncbi:hydroxysqualene dehydroxylase [Nocardia takedensis]|uniref:hydroxysqualene dehydroxylase n=1 Tax=Nocardia takedensis TaxID=259390 RepID=UPI000313BA19|nr:FAD-dependent oxidoreductase [Nocardia takedensis]